MKSSHADYFNIGPRLTLAFGVLIALILGGNGLVIWQFYMARVQTDRLAGANQQLTAVLQLQVSLLSFHQRLDDLARSSDARRLTTEAEPLRRVLRERAQQTRAAIANLPPETRVDAAFLPTLETIEVTLPAQLDAINELARLGDWGTVQRRLGNELRPIETQTSDLVDSIDQQARGELTHTVRRMRSVQRSSLIIVPATAISTFCVAVFLGWRVARKIIELRLDERVSERTRIARELHDTLLQSFHGLMFRFQAARNMLPRRPEEALQALDDALERTEQAIAEGRDAIRDLRASTVITNELAQAVTALGNEMASQDSAKFQVVVAGTPRDLHPILRDEVYAIAREAVRNAFRHAQARNIEAEITYNRSSFELRIRDDGKGIEPGIVAEGRAGHYGVSGMHERAKRIGGKLEVWTGTGAGTEIELRIPWSIAHGASPGRTVFGLFRKKAANS
jgi:signal transduction histidine kinase